jgi:hypothetical protein
MTFFPILCRPGDTLKPPPPALKKFRAQPSFAAAISQLLEPVSCMQEEAVEHAEAHKDAEENGNVLPDGGVVAVRVAG